MTPRLDLGDRVDVLTWGGRTVSGKILGGNSGATIWLHIEVNAHKVLCIPWALIAQVVPTIEEMRRRDRQRRRSA